MIEKLKNPIKILKALEEEILEVLTDMLTDFRSYVNPDIMDNTMEVILILTGNLEAALKIIKNKNLMDILMYFFYDDKLMMASAQILFSLSSNILGKLNKNCNYSFLNKFPTI